MKTNKITTAASILLTASIAFMSTACSVRIKDDGNTVERILAAASEKTSISVEGDNSEDITTGTDEQNDSDIDITIPSSNRSGNIPTDETTGASTKAEDIKINEKTNEVAETTVASKETEKVEATETASETKIEETKAQVTAEPTEAPTATPTAKPNINKNKGEKQNYVKEFNIGTNNKFLECDLGYFSVEAGDKEVLITHDDEVFDLPITYSDELGVVIANCFLVDRNGTKFIWVCDTVGNDLHDTCVYRLEDDGIIFMGVLYDVSFVDIKTTEAFFGNEWGGMGIMYAQREYKVADNGMPIPLDNIRYFRDLTYNIAFSRDLTGKVIKDGKVTDEEITVKYNTFVTLAETDGETYLDLFDSNNVFIRVDISDVYDYHYKYFVEDNFYEAIMEIVLDWKAPWEA